MAGKLQRYNKSTWEIFVRPIVKKQRLLIKINEPLIYQEGQEDDWELCTRKYPHWNITETSDFCVNLNPESWSSDDFQMI